MANEIAKLASERKAQNIMILDVSDVLYITDYFVLMDGTSVRHVKAIQEEVHRLLKARGVKPLGIEGQGENRWVLLDYGDVVAHVFLSEEREYYQLERLWRDVPITVYEDGTATADIR